MEDRTTAVHVTHEAVGKIGGIGAVLNGLFTCNAYLKAVQRSIIVGPLFSKDGCVSDRLGTDGHVLYSSLDGLTNTTQYQHELQKVEHQYNTGIVYGTRAFTDSQSGISSTQEILLIDVTSMYKPPVDTLKHRMFERFGIQSNLYEHLWEYEQYVRLALPAIAAVKAIGAAGDSTIIIAHEFMGMPAALAAILDTSHSFKTAFYAHEVAAIRQLVERHPGHDTMFYNVLEKARKEGLYLSDVFGDQSGYFKHPLVEASQNCDCILAVGNYTAEELRFLSPAFETANINVVYNGVPAYETDLVEKTKSRRRLQLYCENLLGSRPDYVFTHVTRLVTSKALWRDLHVLKYMDEIFTKEGKTAVFLLLSTQACQRPSSDIQRMEAAYAWPIAHREGWPDLNDGEADFYTAVQRFNSTSRNIKTVFINQFGFCRATCGSKVPQDMEFIDIRRGSDIEFGQSVYEPFGISQLETLTFGGLCVLSNACGCAGFLADVTDGDSFGNFLVADYTNLNSHGRKNIDDLLKIDRRLREDIEQSVAKKIAAQILTTLPKDEHQARAMIEAGCRLAKKMSWDVVVQNYLLPSLQKVPAPEENLPTGVL